MQAIIKTEIPGRATYNQPEPQMYQHLCRFWRRQSYGKVLINYNNYLEENPVLDRFLNHGPCITWILDVRTQKFSFVSHNVKEILGYDAHVFLEKGLAFFNQITHPDDVNILWLRVKRHWDFMEILPPHQRKQQKLNNSYRILHPNGTYLKVLEQNSVLQLDDKDNITHIMGVCSDITHLQKKADPVFARVSDVPPAASFIAPQIKLSKRELEIVKLLAAGYKSKDIANNLFISFHTVNTHRQNIIEKTNTKNTSELIQYAMYQRLI